MFQPPILLSMQTGTGYALQFNGPHSYMLALLRTAGECFVKPQLAKPLTSLATTSVSVVAAGLAQTMVVASATGIAVGTALTINDGANTELVIVSAISGTTITADFANAHNGSGTPFAVIGTVFPAAPAATPALSAGQPRQGWFHLSNIGEKVVKGLEGVSTGGSPLYPGAAFDQVYGALIWCVSAGELLIDAH